jgi:hypothetical protein
MKADVPALTLTCTGDAFDSVKLLSQLDNDHVRRELSEWIPVAPASGLGDDISLCPLVP